MTNPDDYQWDGEQYKRKSRHERREIQVDFQGENDKTFKKKVMVDQRQIVFYSEKYAIRSRAKREAAIQKAQKIIENPSAYTRATSYGALKYVQNVEIDKKTGELKKAKSQPCFNVDIIREEERFDGYYAIVTNIFDEPETKGAFDDGKIIDIYRGLWRIEDTFRVSKSDFEARPIFLSREERINAHFLICFISLIFMRLIQRQTGYKHSPARLIEAMNKLSCSHECENLYLFDYRSDITDDLGEAFGIDFTKRRMTRAEIKKILGDAKKVK